jgi:hypothetical protein
MRPAVPSAVLYFVYLLVMGGAFFCFVRAFRLRFDTPRHRRWAGTGVGLSLGGILVVVLAWRLLGWQVPQRWPEVVRWHRVLAYLGLALLLLVAASGLGRWRLHRHLYWAFFPVYGAALVTAAIGYRP